VYTVKQQSNVFVSIQLFVEKPEDFKPVFRRAMSALDYARAQFIAKMREPTETGPTRSSRATDGQPPASMGWLRSVLPMGQDENWHAYSEGSVYVLENQEDSGFRVLGKKPESGEEGRRRISVKVKVDGEVEEGKVIGAGIMFSGNAETKEFYAFILSPDQSVRLYEYNPDEGFHQKMRIGNGRIKKNDFNKIEVVEKGGMVRMPLSYV
jgi:hypothetical protein